MILTARIDGLTWIIVTRMQIFPPEHKHDRVCVCARHVLLLYRNKSRNLENKYKIGNFSRFHRDDETHRDYRVRVTGNRYLFKLRPVQIYNAEANLTGFYSGNYATAAITVGYSLARVARRLIRK